MAREEKVAGIIFPEHLLCSQHYRLSHLTQQTVDEVAAN